VRPLEILEFKNLSEKQDHVPFGKTARNIFNQAMFREIIAA
jgi:hypothetical protein